MKILAHVFWDDEAQLWIAQAEGGLGLVTEAETVGKLKAKVPTIARDLPEGEHKGPLVIELVATGRSGFGCPIEPRLQHMQ